MANFYINGSVLLLFRGIVRGRGEVCQIFTQRLIKLSIGYLRVNSLISLHKPIYRYASGFEFLRNIANLHDFTKSDGTFFLLVNRVEHLLEFLVFNSAFGRDGSIINTKHINFLKFLSAISKKF